MHPVASQMMMSGPVARSTSRIVIAGPQPAHVLCPDDNKSVDGISIIPHTYWIKSSRLLLQTRSFFGFAEKLADLSA